MAEYIDKDKLIDRFDELCNTICQYSKKQRAVMCSSCELGIAFDVVDDFPTEDVQPVMHGKNLKEEWSSLFECSICHWSCWDTYCNDTSGYNYCPNCGAKLMVKHDAEENL